MRALCLTTAPTGRTLPSTAACGLLAGSPGVKPWVAPRRRRRLGPPPASSAPKRTDFDDPQRYPEAPHLHQQVPHPSPESQQEAREGGTPEHVFAREQELDVRAVSHAERAAAHQHTFPELIHGQPGEAAVQHGMSEEQRQVMEAHLHPESAPSGGPATVQHVHAEDARAYGAPDTTGASQAPSASPLQEPDAGRPTSAAGREGGGTVAAGSAQQAPPTAGRMKPRQNRPPPIEGFEEEQ